MPWEEKTTMTQKEEFVQRAKEGKTPFSTLCKEFKISRTLGYEVMKRYQAEGLTGLQTRCRAPLSRPNKTSEKIEAEILNTRSQHPTWGARKILSFLTKKGVVGLPAPSTTNEILKRYGCISLEESAKRQALIRFERDQPNDLWQMDFKGHFQLRIKQSCYPLTVLDDHSRFSICLRACKEEAFSPVKKHLISVFNHYGLPNQINVDNGRPWGNSCLVRYTTLTVWLMRLDILVTHSRPRHPQTNGKNERFHRTLKNDLLNAQRIDNFVQAQKLFDQWRTVYNYERPHEALGMQVPADRYQPSQRQLPTSLPTIEYDPGAILRRTNQAGYISFGKRRFLVGKAFAGFYIELKPNELQGEIALYFGKYKIYTYDLE